MNKPFYNTFKNVRLDRIISLLGKEWFSKKSILELGACYGDIGKELINLGGQLSFSDIRPEYIKYLSSNFIHNEVYTIDQNLSYNLNKNFDLILHLGVLYHLVNWEQDLENALNHTNCLILETLISPTPLEDPQKIYSFSQDNMNPSISYNRNFKKIDENSLIKCFNNLKVKYLRIDTPQMSTPFLLDYKFTYLKFLYGWDINSLPTTLEYEENNNKYIIEPRQMYLILK